MGSGFWEENGAWEKGGLGDYIYMSLSLFALFSTK